LSRLTTSVHTYAFPNPTTDPSDDPKNHSPHFKATLNSHGHQLNILDEYGKAFVKLARTSTKPVADLGVAFGFTTKEILKTGATVFANDLSEEQLKELQNSLTDEERQRCILRPGSALELEFLAGSLGGILALRWFHYLTGPEIRTLLEKFHAWLEPGGRVFITCGTPYSGRSKSFIPEYEARKAAGEEWPGFTAKRIQDVGDRDREFYHKLDPDVLSRELTRRGSRWRRRSLWGDRTTQMTGNWTGGNTWELSVGNLL